MNLAHLHLLLNHVPTIGTALAIALLVLAFVRKNDDLKRVSLEVFFVIALLTVPAYLTGVAAAQELRDRPDVSTLLINAHLDAALISLALMQLAGGFAWVALWQYRRTGRTGRGSMTGVLLVSVLAMATVARAGNLGGEIRHPEILSEAALAAQAELGTDPGFVNAEALGLWVLDRTWVWPAAEALHFIGLWLLFGVLLVVHLRMLGMLRGVSFAAVHRLLPWAALGYAVNTVTGMMFVTATPEQYALNISFHWKIALLSVAGLSLLYLTVFEGAWHVERGHPAPRRVQAVAATGLVAWVGVMYFGRMLPFIGNAF